MTEASRERLLALLPWALPVLLALYVLWEGPRFHVLGHDYARAWLELTATGLVAVGVALTVAGRRLTASIALAIEVSAASVLTDVMLFATQPVRDLRIYVNAGHAFLDGAAVYTQHALTYYPTDLGRLPYLYAPPTLPFAGILALLPMPATVVAWEALSAGLVLFALRRFGVPWPWAIAALLWAPIAQGLYVGNVAIPAVALFALGLRAGWMLPIGSLLKPQDAVLSLWLVRDRRWRPLLAGAAVVAGLAVLTVPLVGLSRWPEWLRGLAAYRASQQLQPGFYGLGLARVLPYTVYAILAVAAVGTALAFRGRKGLAAMGIASVAASPVAWAHGYVAAVPAFLMLSGPLFWLALGLTSLSNGPGWQLSLALGALPFFVPAVRHVAGEHLHPLGRATMPWPGDAADEPAAIGDEDALDEEVRAA